MNLQLVTVALDPATGAFPPDPLAGIEGEILSVVEHFFHHLGLPHLLLVVHHRPLEDKEPRSARRKRQRIDHAESLEPADRRLYEKLRAWRRSRADADGVPVYVILDNRQLATISRQRPTTIEDLRQIDGIGENKSARYGRNVLRLVEQEQKAAASAGQPAMVEREA